MRFAILLNRSASVPTKSVHGNLLTGTITAGDEVLVLPGVETNVIESIKRKGRPYQTCETSTDIELSLTDEICYPPGSFITSIKSPPETTDQFQAELHWRGADDLLPGRSYRVQTANHSVMGYVSKLKFVGKKDTAHPLAAPTLRAGEVGLCNFALSIPIVIDAYADNTVTGSFTVLDEETGELLASGFVVHGLSRATNVRRQRLDVGKNIRSTIKQQKPCVLWLTGLSGSGKSTIANLVEKKLLAAARHTYLLDGDNIRQGLNRDLGFTDADRVENIRRVAETAKLMVDAGLIVITSFISPFRAERSMARNLFESGEFFEVFVDTPFHVCEQRDPKGLYRKARAGAIKNFTGLDSPYEEPADADIHLRTTEEEAEAAAARVVAYLEKQLTS